LQRTPRPAAELHADRERIIELFGRRQPVYSTAEVVGLLGISEGQLADAIAKDTVGTEANDVGAQVIPWEDVAILALEEWTPRMIEAALDGDRDEIPLLNQHRLIRVSLPIYLIRLMDHLARFESTTRHVPRNASDIIERILHEFANAQDTAALDGEIPGFVQALDYPYFTLRRTGVLCLRCRYCGIAISEPVREVCRTCERRHEPNEHLGEYGLPELEEHDDAPLQPPKPAPTPQNHHRRSTKRRSGTRRKKAGRRDKARRR
jgi:hypothetical protein